MASRKSTPRGSKTKKKISRVLKEYSEGDLHSGSKHGPLVTNKDQALAIAISESKKKKKRKKKKSKKDSDGY